MRGFFFADVHGLATNFFPAEFSNCRIQYCPPLTSIVTPVT